MEDFSLALLEDVQELRVLTVFGENRLPQKVA
jgi:hypothetical protein